MSILKFNVDNCKNCYKCLRECPVKAISMLNDRAEIVEDLCILCGKCTNVCPQNAKVVIDSTPSIKRLLQENSNVYASIAPSFISNFNIKSIVPLRKALKELGFKDAFETAEGAKYVNKRYQEILNKKDYPNFITSACPSIVSLITKYYPKALKYLAQVDSPMVAHGKMIKEKDQNAKVVFIGPCISKKKEANEAMVIDDVLTFIELEEWLKEVGINLEILDLETTETEINENKARYYPIERGIIKSIGEYREGYDYISVSGVEKCKEVLSNIDNLSDMFIEMSACDYSCINGPAAIKKKGGCIKAVEVVRKYTKGIGNSPVDISLYKADINANYQCENVGLEMPDEATIKTILLTFGKNKKTDELNCGACGYPTCRDKAIAVFNKMAQKEMCLPFMKEKAESLSNQVISNSPNGIITFDKNMIVQECNLSAQKMLGIEVEKVIKKPIRDIPEMSFLDISEITSNKVHLQKYHLEKTNKDVEVSFVYIEKQHISFCIIRDLTIDEENVRKLMELKQSTIDLTNKVIEKQMRSVQEIASLLGETTAETKIAIYNLRKILLKDE